MIYIIWLFKKMLWKLQYADKLHIGPGKKDLTHLSIYI